MSEKSLKRGRLGSKSKEKAFALMSSALLAGSDVHLPSDMTTAEAAQPAKTIHPEKPTSTTLERKIEKEPREKGSLVVVISYEKNIKMNYDRLTTPLIDALQNAKIPQAIKVVVTYSTPDGSAVRQEAYPILKMKGSEFKGEDLKKIMEKHGPGSLGTVDVQYNLNIAQWTMNGLEAETPGEQCNMLLSIMPTTTDIRDQVMKSSRESTKDFLAVVQLEPAPSEPTRNIKIPITSNPEKNMEYLKATADNLGAAVRYLLREWESQCTDSAH
ncbi:MAG TPA: hypothetical protein VJB65_02000 [Patescibacteria group bacterium]|nr:hypothetical protein [Patescibacteria group bacterium]